jgi:hypothetical protein
MGRHDENAYYWPSYNVRAFRRGAAEFVSKLHEEVGRIKGDVYDVPHDGGVCIHNLSHRDAHQWIEKTNRYTDERDRVSFFDANTPLETFGQERIAFWLAQSRSRSDYVVGTALLRAVYDIVDRVKLWEAQDGLDGDAAFAAVCAELEATYDAFGLDRGPPNAHATIPSPSPTPRLRAALKRIAARLKGEKH